MNPQSDPGGTPTGVDTGKDQGHPASSSLEHLEGQDVGLLRMLKAEVESLKNMAKRTQVKGLKESVDRVCSIIGSIESNSIELKAARRQQLGSNLMVVDAKKVVTILTQNINSAVVSSNKVVLDAIAGVGAKVTGEHEDDNSGRSGGNNSTEVKAAVANLHALIEAQGAKIEEIAELGKQSSWTEVVKKNKRKDKGDKPVEKPDVPVMTQRRGTCPPAILVDVSKEDFPELAKKIRGGACRDIIGNRVVGMRQARSGGLLIEVRGNADEVSAVRAEISRSAGAEIGVRTLQQRELLEVRDLDQWSDGPEVLEAIALASGCDTASLRLVSLRKRFGGAQLALVSAPKDAAQAIIRQGRLRVGMVSCSVRRCDAKVRCFRCLSHGHEAKSCQGPDRTKCCRRCGQDGHYAKTCTATQEEALSFTKALATTNKAVSNDGKEVDKTSQ